jgi:hypothetical protein
MAAFGRVEWSKGLDGTQAKREVANVAVFERTDPGAKIERCTGKYGLGEGAVEVGEVQFEFLVGVDIVGVQSGRPHAERN